ncbi:ABC transporter substrate-binding protein [Thauera sp. AutoDN2]|uniref:ABC transporter substrate-binding protein n=1 Tax=Thauera sp. AutoDN2 TaxID=3416051 RepID=UPI003F4AF910
MRGADHTAAPWWWRTRYEGGICSRLMLRRRFLSLLAASIAVPPFATACRKQGAFRVGIHPWPGYEPLYLAREFGWLPAAVDLRAGRNAGDSIAAMVAGEVDAAALTLDEVLVVRDQGVHASVVLVFNHSVGADAVMVRAEIESPAQVRGRRVALERGAVGEFVLHRLLQAAGLREVDVTLIDIPPDRQLDAWRAGEMDVAIAYEPALSLLEREGGRRIFDSRQFPGLIFDVLAVRSDRLSGQKKVLDALLAAHFRALAHMRVNREDALRRIGAWRGLGFEETERSFAGLSLPDVLGNRAYLDPAGARSIVPAARELAGLMRGAGRLTSDDRLDRLVDPDFLPRNRVSL